MTSHTTLLFFHPVRSAAWALQEILGMLNFFKPLFIVRRKSSQAHQPMITCAKPRQLGTKSIYSIGHFLMRKLRCKQHYKEST
eukprot:scaffold151267_cov24-Prasinocladus_malaysianus.AAC.1